MKAERFSKILRFILALIGFNVMVLVNPINRIYDILGGFFLGLAVVAIFELTNDGDK